MRELPIEISEKQIYLACGATDMRKSINGLCATVITSFKLEPASEMIFIFCNKPKDTIKILHWDGSGFWLHMKRLENGRFAWPAKHPDNKTMTITKDGLFLLLAKPGFEQKLKRKNTTFEMIA